MSAVMISRFTIKNPDKFQAYFSRVQQIASAYGAQPLFRGRLDRTLNGSDDEAVVVIIKFPSADSINAWFDSPEYADIIPLREEAADMQMTSYTAMT